MGQQLAAKDLNGISFTVNGKLHTVNSPEIGTTLNSWLRSEAKLTGTKVMCNEGGCGSCVVMVTRPDPATGEDVSVAVNSCLFPLLSLDGCHVTTTEGLVSEDGQYHEIQQRMAGFNATQCGYCTPGFVMTMYSFLQRNPNPTQEEVEAEFDGNICRCTGFRPIFDAMKSFAKDADPKLLQLCSDIEELRVCRQNKAACSEDGKQCNKGCGRYTADGSSLKLKTLEKDFDHMMMNRPLRVEKTSGEASVSWIRPTTLQELTEVVSSNSGKKIRFVVGNTSVGVFKNDGEPDVYIDTKLVKELYQIGDSTSSVQLGANVCLNDVISTLGNKSSESATFDVMVKHLRKIANVPVRNVGSWIGNLTMKKNHPEFPSDVFTLFETFSVQLLIRDCTTQTNSVHGLIGDDGYMSLDMDGKVVLSATVPKVLPGSPDAYKALSYKVMPRSQNAHAYVNAGFSTYIKNGIIDNSPRLVFGGISKTFVHALETEKYLLGRDVNSQDTLNGALKALEAELKPESYSAADSSAKYRTSLALGLFYKFYLTLCNPATVTPDVTTASATLDRPVTSATQTYGSDASMYPVTEPMPKVTAIKQASGEAKYISDFSAHSDELFATFLKSTVANADIDTIDTSDALNIPGCVAVVTASDLTPELKNTFIPPPYANQPIIADGHVDFAGQPVAIVIADTPLHAQQICDSVKVTYKNQQQGVFEIQEAISKGMFFDGAGDPVVIGDAPTAIKNAEHKISGNFQMGSQYHFYMETQICRAKPTEDGFDVECGTQWQDIVQASLAHILGWDYNRLNIITTRVGGAYGGKATNSMIAAAGATAASYLTGKPVRMHSDLSTCMETYGTRAAYVADYSVGFDDNGVVQGIETTYYSDSGVSPNDSDVVSISIQQFADSGYHCDNWKLTPQWVRTDITSNTWCRAPTSAQLTMAMEVILEHVAKSLNLDPIQVKLANLYEQNQLNLFREPLTYCNIRPLSDSLLAMADVATRQSQIESFNKANKWKKRGIGFTPIKFGLIWNSANYANQVSIFHGDGSIVLSAGGIESGQGLNTKVIQVAAYVLGAPMDLIRVKEASVLRSPNCAPTGGSLTSELCCKGILEACKILKSRIEDARNKLELGSDLSWPETIAKCYENGVNLTAQYWVFNNTEKMVQYNSYGASCSEVELDVITGEHVIRRVDTLYDCGQSINPDIDVGQVEGAFLMGVGFYTSEKLIRDPTDGRLVTNNTWEYKPPASKDIPSVWNITLLKDAPNPSGVLSSKAAGEPPLCTAASVFFAIKRCIEAFRQSDSHFTMDVPATVSDVQQLCQIVTSDFTI